MTWEELAYRNLQKSEQSDFKILYQSIQQSSNSPNTSSDQWHVNGRPWHLKSSYNAFHCVHGEGRVLGSPVDGDSTIILRRHNGQTAKAEAVCKNVRESKCLLRNKYFPTEIQSILMYLNFFANFFYMSDWIICKLFHTIRRIINFTEHVSYFYFSNTFQWFYDGFKNRLNISWKTSLLWVNL